MTYEEMAVKIVEECNSIIYVADIETHEVLFLNQEAMQILRLNDDNDWVGKKCYEVIQNKNEPCRFCTNHLLNEQEFYCWEYYNEQIGRYYSLRDKLIDLNGKKVRLELAIDITQKEEALRQFKKKLEMEEMLVHCIRTLNQGKNIDETIAVLISYISEYYHSDRAYIYEMSDENNLVKHAYEGAKEEDTEAIPKLQSISVEVWKNWLRDMGEVEVIHIADIEKKEVKTEIDQVLISKHGLHDLIIVPLVTEGEICGLLCLENPAQNTEDIVFLHSVSSFISVDLKRRKLMEQLYTMSYRDNLTGLYNRHKYMEHMKEMESSPPDTLGIIYADINGLKIANDTYGHQYGDFLIKSAAKELLRFSEKGVYRIGGDEFVIFCENIDKESFDEKVQELRWRIDSKDELRMSIGTSWGKDYIDVFRQVSHADELMYIDKQTYYGMRLEGMGKYHSGLSSALLSEIEAGRFVVYLQPKIYLKTGEISGAEALVRRKEKNGTMVPPNKFIQRYESEGIIRHVDFFVLETVCSTIQKWKRLGLDEITVAVNFSRVTLVEYNITEKLLSVCNEYGVKPSQISIEVTENIGKMEQEDLKELILLLGKAGFAISLDDFGTEYSNLAILASMDFDEVKLDKSLVEHLERNNKYQVIASHTIKMCEELGFASSVAEGIETPEQRALLEQLDCDIGQGYFFDKPMKIDEFELIYMNNLKRKQ